MLQDDYLSFNWDYPPNIDFNKNLHLNPKIFKLQKFFSKRISNDWNEHRRLSQNFDAYWFKQKKMKRESSISIPNSNYYLPKITKPDIQPKFSKEKIENRWSSIKTEEKIEPNRQIPKIDSNRQIPQNVPNIRQNIKSFNFKSLEHYRSASNSEEKKKNMIKNHDLEAFYDNKPNTIIQTQNVSKKILNSIWKEEKSGIKKKIIFSKKNKVDAKDFSCFFDSQDNQKTINSAFSNF